MRLFSRHFQQIKIFENTIRVKFQVANEIQKRYFSRVTKFSKIEFVCFFFFFQNNQLGESRREEKKESQKLSSYCESDLFN